MKIKGLISEDFVNYKKPAMTIMFPYCTFKCGTEYCQNSPLSKAEDIEMDISNIVIRYLNNHITESVVMQGLEPFDSWDDLSEFVKQLRESTDDDIVIYTGYYKEEIIDKVEILRKYKNIIIKYGRFLYNDKPIFDDILGITLASSNQYAERIS